MVTLTNEERLIVQGARKRIEQGKDSFICVAMDMAIITRREEFSNAEYLGLINLAVRMKGCVIGSLHPFSTLDAWLYCHAGYRSQAYFFDQYKTSRPAIMLPYDKYRQMIKECRLAWLDRMEATGRIE